jgi:hypothetical protein
MKNEENKGNNAIVWMFLVECDEKWRKLRKLCNFLNVSCWMRWKMKKIMQFFECFLLNAMKNEENKGKNAIFWMFLVECDKKWRK